MHLTTTVVVGLLLIAFVLAKIAGKVVLEKEYPWWGDRLARLFVTIATIELPAEARLRWREEWLGELDELQHGLRLSVSERQAIRKAVDAEAAPPKAKPTTTKSFEFTHVLEHGNTVDQTAIRVTYADGTETFEIVDPPERQLRARLYGRFTLAAAVALTVAVGVPTALHKG
jgi:hypothetical protein